MTEHGAMPAARLYESPFTDIHAQGPDGVFDGNKVEQLFQALQGLELQQAATQGHAGCRAGASASIRRQPKLTLHSPK